MSGSRPKIGLILKTDIPQEWIEEFLSTVKLNRSEVEIRKIYSGPMAGLALYLPTTVMVFFASFYLQGILAEAGKHHYVLLKKATRSLWHRLKLVRVFSVGPKAKTGDFDRFQMAFSINGETPDGKTFKLVLQLNTSDSLADAGIDGFIDLIKSMNDGTLPGDQVERLKAYRSIGDVTVVTIDTQTGEIVPADKLPIVE